MQNSKIEWTHHTFNPWRGCTKVSEGCKNCYAESLSGRNPKTLGVWGPNGTRVVAAESAWREPLKWNAAAAAVGERHRVFCASLADVFEAWDGPMTAANGNRLWWCHGSLSNSPLPSVGLEAGCRFATMDDVRDRLLDLVDQTPHLDWLLLTKRPEHVAATLERIGHKLPTNVWLGTSVEDQAAADERIPRLLATPAAVRFLSCEPLLGAVDLTRVNFGGGSGNGTPMGVCNTLGRSGGTDTPIDWVIVGGESGRGARPMHPDWARSLRDQCVAAGVAFHFKQWGEYAPDSAGGMFSVGDKSGHTVDELGRLDVRHGGGDLIQLRRVGKKDAGRLLDGRTWDEFPCPAGKEGV